MFLQLIEKIRLYQDKFIFWHLFDIEEITSSILITPTNSTLN